MAKTKEIIELINGFIKASLSDQRFNKSQYSNLAVTLKKNQDGQGAPTIFQNDGDAKEISIDDDYPVQIYHKNLGSTYVKGKNASEYGDPNVAKNVVNSQRTNISMVVMGNRKKIKITPEELEDLIVIAFPEVLSSADRETLGIENCSIILVASDHDSQKLFVREYALQNKTLDPEKILFEIRYQIECIYKNGCINILCC